jgi:hypothetical protein
MPIPIDILLNPWPNLGVHSAIFIISLLIMILWINGTVENPWAPTIVFFTFALFNLLLAIRNKMINGSSNNIDGDDDDDEVEGGNEVSGGHTINKQPSVSHTHDPNDEPGAKHGGSPTGNASPTGTTYQATQKNNSPKVASADELAKKPADIKARMGPAAQRANNMSDMGPDVNFFPDQ